MTSTWLRWRSTSAPRTSRCPQKTIPWCLAGRGASLQPAGASWVREHFYLTRCPTKLAALRAKKCRAREPGHSWPSGTRQNDTAQSNILHGGTPASPGTRVILSLGAQGFVRCTAQAGSHTHGHMRPALTNPTPSCPSQATKFASASRTVGGRAAGSRGRWGRGGRRQAACAGPDCLGPLRLPLVSPHAMGPREATGVCKPCAELSTAAAPARLGGAARRPRAAGDAPNPARATARTRGGPRAPKHAAPTRPPPPSLLRPTDGLQTNMGLYLKQYMGEQPARLCELHARSPVPAQPVVAVTLWHE